MRFFVFFCIVASLCLAEMNIVYLKQAAVNEGAVCLDGTPGIYYFKAGSPANSTKWVIHLLGGGLCLNNEECLMRSQTYLGSSSYWPAQIKYGGPLHEDPAYNPDFYDWNHVFLAYCDGASFSGDVAEPVKVAFGVVYYRGHRILLATIKDLLKNKGLDKATDVFVVGDSAGGMATFYHADEIKSMMPKSVTRFKAAPFSGVFLDVPNAEGTVFYINDMKHVFEMQNCSGGLDQRCIEAQSPDEGHKCMLAQYSMEHTQTPLFVMGSAYDSIGLSCIEGGEPETSPIATGAGNCSAVPGWGECEENPSQCTQEQWDKIQDYASTFLKVIMFNPKFTQNGNGLFEYSCHSHAAESTNAWVFVSVQGTVMRDAVRKWYFSDDEPSSNHFYKDCVNYGSFSCNPTCEYPSKK